MTSYPIDEDLYQCQDCRALWKLDELGPIADIFERVEPGEIMPAGECPDCGALCHVDLAAAIAASVAELATSPDTWHYACPECHCTEIQQTAWIYMNTGENTGDEGPSDIAWCPDCGDAGDGEIKMRAVIQINGDRTLMRGWDGKERPYVGPGGNY